MKKWLEIYNDASSRTRWISFGVGVCLWFVYLVELAEYFYYLRFVNVSFFRMFADGVFPLFSILALILPILALAMVTLRVFAIMGNRPRIARISWNLMLLIFAVTYVYFFLDSVDYFKPPSNCTPSETNICYAVYDMRKFPVWPLATFVYLSIGTVGIIAKSVYTTFKYNGLSHNVREVDHI